MKVNDDPIIIEQFFNSPIDSVWNAISNVEEMRKWFFDNVPEFKPEVGFKTQFNVKSEDRNFLHSWKVIEVIPNNLLKYNWSYEDYDGDSNVIFELTEENNRTKLKLSHEILEDFPEDIPEFKRESCIGGWTYFINNRLKEYLENKK